MSKKLKCPQCGTENEGDFTVWKKGEVGYTVHFDGTDIDPDEMLYDETHIEVYSCQCGYESEWQSDFIVEGEE